MRVDARGATLFDEGRSPQGRRVGPSALLALPDRRRGGGAAAGNQIPGGPRSLKRV